MTIQRRLHSSNGHDSRGDLSIRTVDVHARPLTLLEQLLGGVDEPTFNNVFAVGLRELQELGSLDDTHAADLLYKLTAGLDRVSLADVISDLTDSCNRLMDPEGGSCQIGELLERRDVTRRRVEELSQSGRRWLQLQEDLATLRDDVQQLDALKTDAEKESRTIAIALQVRDPWDEAADLNERLEELGETVELPDGALEQLEEIGQDIADRMKQVVELKQRRQAVRYEAAAQLVNKSLQAHAARIEALAEHAPWIASIERQITRLVGETEKLEVELSDASGKWGVPEAAAADLPEVSRDTLSLLRVPARNVRDETQRLKQATEEQTAAAQEFEEVTLQLESTLLERGQGNLAAAVDETSGRVRMLRKRLQTEERIEKMTRHRKELEEEHQELLEDQVLPLSTLAWLGVPFVVGVMLILGGLYWSSAAKLGWPVALLGLGGWGLAIAVKVSLERNAARELEQCERQLELLHRQLREAREEREQLDEQMPRGGGPWDVRLAAAEEELEKLEQLLPMEADVQAAAQRADAAERRVRQVTDALEDARAQWRNGLRRAGLPDSYSPQAVRQLAEGSAQSLRSQRHLQSRVEELDARRQELRDITERIELIAAEVGLDTEHGDPQMMLRQLTAAVTVQQKIVERRTQLVREDRQIGREGRAAVRELRKLHRQRRTLVARAGADDVDELRDMVARHVKRTELADQLDRVTAQIDAAIGDHCDWDTIEETLTQYTGEQLENRRDQLAKQLSQTQTRLATLYEKRGELTQKMKSLAEDQDWAQAKMELSGVELQLKEAIERWRALAATKRALWRVCELYETERQPETLKVASTYLVKLTEGHYTRVWTPLGENALRVETGDGKSLPLEVLSRGTREAVFISLRLALVADFARRGAILPLVLDDVLVNFDRCRARAAARVLQDFARNGHQVLLFTCHEHIVELFEGEQVDIRILPGHADLNVDAPRFVVAEEPEFEEEEIPVEVMVVEEEEDEEDEEDLLNLPEDEDEYEEINEVDDNVEYEDDYDLVDEEEDEYEEEPEELDLVEEDDSEYELADAVSPAIDVGLETYLVEEDQEEEEDELEDDDDWEYEEEDYELEDELEDQEEPTEEEPVEEKSSRKKSSRKKSSRKKSKRFSCKRRSQPTFAANDLLGNHQNAGGTTTLPRSKGCKRAVPAVGTSPTEAGMGGRGSCRAVAEQLSLRGSLGSATLVPPSTTSVHIGAKMVLCRGCVVLCWDGASLVKLADNRAIAAIDADGNPAQVHVCRQRREQGKRRQN